MMTYFIRRLLLVIPLVFVISVLSFALMHLAPGGPFDRERAPAAPEIERNLRAKYHLDEPAWKQYARYLNDLAHGDLGVSLKYRNHSVNEVIAQALPVSLSLGGLAFCLAIGLGVPMGCLGAMRRGRWLDHWTSAAAILMICIPGFVVAPLLVIWFALRWHWFPAALWGSPRHAVLPVIALGIFFAGRVARLMREGMVTTLQTEYILTARAKGLSEMAVMLRHALPVAVLPVVSYSGPMLADLFTGSFVIESIFQIPGLGAFVVNGSLNRDYTLVIGLVVLYAMLLILLNLLVDALYVWLDPRVRYD